MTGSLYHQREAPSLTLSCIRSSLPSLQDASHLTTACSFSEASSLISSSHPQPSTSPHLTMPGSFSEAPSLISSSPSAAVYLVSSYNAGQLHLGTLTDPATLLISSSHPLQPPCTHPTAAGSFTDLGWKQGPWQAGKERRKAGSTFFDGAAGLEARPAPQEILRRAEIVSKAHGSDNVEGLALEGLVDVDGGPPGTVQPLQQAVQHFQDRGKTPPAHVPCKGQFTRQCLIPLPTAQPLLQACAISSQGCSKAYLFQHPHSPGKARYNHITFTELGITGRTRFGALTLPTCGNDLHVGTTRLAFCCDA